MGVLAFLRRHPRAVLGLLAANEALSWLILPWLVGVLRWELGIIASLA